MINKKMKLRFLSLILLGILSVNTYSQDVKFDKQDNKARKTETKADRKFVEQNFEKAMKLYESALKDAKTEVYTATLHLKTARLYLTLLDYKASIPHYDAAISTNDNLFTAVDICNYLDALRYSGEKSKAIKVAREYAYRDVYKKDQRYLNILHALNYEDGFLPVGTPEFNVQKLDKFNTPYSEFWVGKMKNEYFYATSSSQFHDPNKKFYHRTRYYSLDENSEHAINSKNKKKKTKPLLHMIPIDLQNGPLSFSDDMSKMIVTEVAYDKGESIEMSSGGVNTYKTKLCYSEFDRKRKGWSAFRNAFPQKKEASYAHPFIFNNNRSVLFSSDMTGGYGGYDIYIVHWDEKLRSWGDPINLGPQVNTEGDEISPALFNDMLVFSSNGHVGFGGYDIYGISYENGKVVEGSLTHFDYPINTVLNDFSMLRIDKDRGYVVSDRQRVNKDDIFYFERNTDFGKDNLIYGMSERDAISNGVISLVKNEGNHNSPRLESIPQFSIESESLLSVYFDFDKANLLPSAIEELKSWVANHDFQNVDHLIIDGYADEMGTDMYNYSLSRQRAETVAKWLSDQGIKAKARVTGKGKVAVQNEDSPLQSPILSNDKQSAGAFWNHRIWMNRKARRVDIKAIIK